MKQHPSNPHFRTRLCKPNYQQARVTRFGIEIDPGIEFGIELRIELAVAVAAKDRDRDRDK